MKNAVFDKPAGKNSLNLSFFPHSSEMIGKTRSSSKKFYHPIFPQDTEISLLTHLAISFFLRIKPSSAQRPKDVLSCTFLSKIVFTQSVCWTQEMQTWQLCWIEFAKLRSFFCSKPQNMDKNVCISPKQFFLEMFAGQEKSSIDKYAGISSLNSGIFSAQSPKIIGKVVFILPIDFTWKFLMDTKKAILTAMPKHFCWSRDFLGSNFGKIERNCKFFIEPIFPQSVLWTSTNAILTTLLQWFCRKREFCRLKAEIDRKNVSFSRETIFC